MEADDLAGSAPVVINEQEPVEFRRRFLAAAAGRGPVFLANPAWGSEERAEFDRFVSQVPTNWDAERAWLMIPTGGTTGGIKLARHDQHTIAAAVAGFAAHFGISRINAVGALPLHHVGGLMGWLRAALTGGEFRDEDWQRLKQEPRGTSPGNDWVVSLVPTQLGRLLATDGGRAWLGGFGVVLLGGAALPMSAAIEARAAGIRCALGYGMTETMAMATALRPDEFLAGRSDSGGPLPHAEVNIDATRRLQVSGASLFRGYWPDYRESGPWLTADRGEFEANGGLRVWGRMDDLVNSGGEKVDVAEVERVLSEVLPAVPLAVLGVADATWGQRVVACYEGGSRRLDPEEIEAILAGKLAKFKWPKAYVPIDPWPVNQMGKVNRSELRRRVGDLATGSNLSD